MKYIVVGLLLAGCGAKSATPPRPITDAHVDSWTPPDRATSIDSAITDDGGLAAEAPEKDPRSATVKLKLIITPAAQGVVVWGRKKLAELDGLHMTMEVERPRGSGPLDVIIRATGFLPHHVRLFTDRDDRLNVRLHRPDDAQGLLGYRRPAGQP